jgi:hypothetical protein
MTLRAPLDGILTVMPNNGMRWWGNEFKEGTGLARRAHRRIA